MIDSWLKEQLDLLEAGLEQAQCLVERSVGSGSMKSLPADLRKLSVFTV